MAKESPITGLDPGDPLGLFTAFGDWSPSDVNMFDPLDRWDDKWKAIGWEPYHEGGKFNFYDPLDLTDRVAGATGMDSDTVGAIVGLVGSLFGNFGSLGASAAVGGSQGRGTEGAMNSLGGAFLGGVAGDAVGGALGSLGSAVGGESLGQAGSALGRQLGQTGLSYLAAERANDNMPSPAQPPANVNSGAITAPTLSGGSSGGGLNISNSTAPQIYPWRTRRG